MKKFAKMSLVAAVAVAGLTSTVSAKDLAEAIKGVDVSGTVALRYDDRTQDNDTVEAGNNDTNNSYKIAINTKAKINDNLTANTRTVIGDGTTNMKGVDSNDADSEGSLALTQLNFAYTGFANTTVILGKQAVPSPFSVQADAAGNENTGTGVTAVVNAGIATIAATYLNNTNLVTAGQDIAGLGVMAPVGPVSLDAWYLDVAETSAANSGHQAYTIGAAAKIEGVSVYARHSGIAHDTTNTDTEYLTKLGAKAKVGTVGFGVDYGWTNKTNSAYVTGVQLHSDADAAASFQGWGLNLNSNDSTLLKLNVNVDVMAGINLSVNHNIKTQDTSNAGVAITNGDAEETYAQLTHKMGKNFMYYVRLGQVEKDSAPMNDGTRGRLHVQYSF